MNSRYLDAMAAQIDLLQFYEAWEKNIELRQGIFPFGPGAPLEMALETIQALTGNLRFATPIYISPDIGDLLDDAMGSLDPETRVFKELFPTPFGFAYLGGEEWPLPRTLAGFEHTFRAFSWMVVDNAVTILAFGRSWQDGIDTKADQLNQLVGVVAWKFGRSISEDLPSLIDDPDAPFDYPYTAADGSTQYVTATAGQGQVYVREQWQTVRLYVLSILSFMGQRIAIKSLDRVDRATRRRLPDNFQGGEFVTTVMLRALDYAGRKAPAGAEPGYHIGVRYIRRGHWAHAWCQGSRKKTLEQCVVGHRHEPMLEMRWKDSTVCGPADAPLNSSTKLFAVVR